MRRDVLTILCITALVVAAVVAFGPLMVDLSPAAPTRASSVPIAPDTPRESTPPPPETRRSALAFEISDAVTGARVESHAAVTLTRADGRLVDVVRGRVNGEPIEFAELPAEPLSVHVRLTGYVEHTQDPVTPAGQTLKLQLTPLYVVTFRAHGAKPTSVCVFSETVPAYPELLPYTHWEMLRAGSATFTLTPGKYWCYVPRGNPLRHEDHADRENWLDTDTLNNNPGLPLIGCGHCFEFEVVDGPVTLSPKITWPEGTGTVTGTIADDKGVPRPDAGLRAYRLGPAFLRELAATTRSQIDGSFEFSKLPPGHYRVQPYDGDHPCQPDAFVFVNVADGATAEVKIVHGGEVDVGDLAEAEPPVGGAVKPPEPAKTDAHDRPTGDVKIKLPTPAPSQPGPSEPQPPPPEPRPSPPPLPPRPGRARGHIEGASLFLYVQGAGESDLWQAMLHLRGRAQGSSAAVLGAGGSYAPVPCLARHNGRLAIYVEGIQSWQHELSLQVPGWKLVTIDVTIPADADVTLVRE